VHISPDLFGGPLSPKSARARTVGRDRTIVAVDKSRSGCAEGLARLVGEVRDRFQPCLEGQHLLDIRRFSSAGRFLELAQLTSSEECSAAAEKVAQVFQRNFGMSDVETRMVNFVITEILENIFNHAFSSIGGLICCQTYPNKSSRALVSLILVGIERSLRANPDNLERLKHANPIEVAVGKKVTGRPAKFGGYGLFLTSKIIEENEGVFGIRSRQHGWTKIPGRIQRKFGLDWPGTALNLFFRTNKPITVAKFFEELTEEYYNCRARSRSGSQIAQQ
jgi:hypothetical protein